MEHIKNFFENFFNKQTWILNENNNEDVFNFKVNFVLTEAKDPAAPWGTEKWLETNPKIQKNAKIRDAVGGKTVVYHSYIINLLPAKESGINVCACATPDCERTCLHQSGNIGMLVGKTASRFRKTWYLYMHTDEALKEIIRQIRAKKQKIDVLNKSKRPYLDFSYDEEGNKIVDHYEELRNPNGKIIKKPVYKKELIKNPRHELVIRLNGTSDLNWIGQEVGSFENIFKMFPDVIFYDYTKNKPTADKFIKGELPDNYHVTYSYGGRENKEKTLEVLNRGGNIAVAFGPGKTHSMESTVFPSKMEDLLHGLKYPIDPATGQSMTPEQQRDYDQQVMATWKKANCYVSESALSNFAGQTLLPGLFDCHEVIDGDSYDGRFLDDHYYHGKEEEFKNFRKLSQSKPGLVVGLTAKGPLTFDFYDDNVGWRADIKDKFVVGPSDEFLNTDKCSSKKIGYTVPFKTLVNKTEIYKKICKAVFIVRSMDARHVSKDMTVNGVLDARKVSYKELGTKQKPIISEPKRETERLQTYSGAKERFSKEMDYVRDIFKYVLTPTDERTPEETEKYNQLIFSKNKEENKKFKDVSDFAERFNSYLNSLIARGQLQMGTKKNLAMLMNPAQLFKAVKEKDVKMLIPLGMLGKLANINKPLTQSPEPKSPDTSGFKEWLSNQ